MKLLTRPTCLPGAGVVVDPDQGSGLLPKFHKALHAETESSKGQGTNFVYYLCNSHDCLPSFLRKQSSSFSIFQSNILSLKELAI